MEEQVIQLISKQLKKDAKDIRLESSVVKDLKANDLDMVEIIMNIEEFFDLQIPDEDAKKFVTVKDIIEYIAHQKK